MKASMPTSDHQGGTDETLLTVPEACERLRISRWSFYQLLRKRQIQTVKIGTRRLVPASSLTLLIAELLTDQQDA